MKKNVKEFSFRQGCVDNILSSSARDDNTRRTRDSSTTKSQVESHYDPEYSSLTTQDLNIHKSMTNVD